MPPRRAPKDRRAQAEHPAAPEQGTMNASEVAAIVAQAVNAALAVVQQAPPQIQAVVPVPAQLPSAWERVRDAFQRAHPPEFSASSDIVTVSQWKKDIQRHLRMYECTDVQRQLLASFKLVGGRFAVVGVHYHLGGEGHGSYSVVLGAI